MGCSYACLKVAPLRCKNKIVKITNTLQKKIVKITNLMVSTVARI